MSTAGTLTAGSSPDHKHANLSPSPEKAASSLPMTSTLDSNKTVGPRVSALAVLPDGRKNLLLFVFSLAMFLDAAGVSSTFILTADIARDLELSLAQSAWVLTSYSLAFAGCLLMAGRLADLFPPHRIWTIGFAGLGILNLIVSFMDNKFAFFIMRALSGVMACLTIPSSLNMIVQMYTDRTEQAKKLALFGLAGALANICGLVLAGAFLQASWHWWFRFVAILAIPGSVLAWFMMPATEAVAMDIPGAAKLKRADIVGVFLMLFSLALFILAFTLATEDGYDSAGFLAPFLISLSLVAAFIFWESRLPEGYALMPRNTFSLPNFAPLSLLALTLFGWFATSQLRFATYWQEVAHYSAIHTAVLLLPMGVVALIAGAATQVWPRLITHPRIPAIGSITLAIVGMILFIFSDGGIGRYNYWAFVFTGSVIGTVGVLHLFVAIQSNLIQAFPPEMAGVAGSYTQVLFQVGGVISIAIQTGLDSVGDGLADWKGTQAGFGFIAGWVAFWGIVFIVLWRQDKVPTDREEKVIAV